MKNESRGGSIVERERGRGKLREKEGGGESKRSFEIQRGRRSTILYEHKTGRMGGELRKEYRGREEEGCMEREKRMRGGR